MKILFDSQVFVNQKFGGVSRYHFELLKALKNLKCLPTISGRFIRNLYVLNDSELKKQFVFDKYNTLSFVNKLFIRLSIKKARGYDIYHPTIAKDYILSGIPENSKVVFTVHDMIPEKLKGVSKEGTLKYALALRADKIIAVSQQTKQDLVNIYNIPHEKVTVIYHGCTYMTEEPVDDQYLSLPKTYVLFVGERNGYKNFNALLGSISPLLSEKLSLVCAGGSAFTDEEIAMLDQLNVKKYVKQYLNLNDQTLYKIYKNAKIFVFPSLYEGFGIPILEAWMCEIPVLLSNASSFPEIAQDAAYYFNPTDKNAIFDAVSMMLSNDRLCSDLVKKGLDRVQFFTWERAAKETLKVYKSLV